MLVDGHLGVTLLLSIPHPYFLTSWCSLGFPRPPGWPTIGLHSAGLQAQLRDCRESLEAATETSILIRQGILRIRNEGPGNDSPPRTADSRQDAEGTFATWGRRLPFIWGIGVRLARQLPGKPASGAGGKHVGNY